MPIRTGLSGPLQARPYRVDLSVDGTGWLGGFTGLHPAYATLRLPQLGRLHWTTWTSHEGRAWGAEWVDPCTPSCGGGFFRPYKATVYVYDPGRSGVFLHMTVVSAYSNKYAPHRTTYVASYGSGGWGWGVPAMMQPGEFSS